MSRRCVLRLPCVGPTRDPQTWFGGINYPNTRDPLMRHALGGDQFGLPDILGNRISPPRWWSYNLVSILFTAAAAFTFSTIHNRRSYTYQYLRELSNNGASLVEWIHAKLSQFIHVPRIVVAISSFVLTLYWDCRRNNHFSTITSNQHSAGATTTWSDQHFLKLLVQSFCRLLPIYPFLAVIISLGFLLVITIFERLHLPLEILNMPIYYGTLYG
jgi:hypothetical protein